MFQPDDAPPASLIQRIRARFGARAGGVMLTLAFEALLLVLLLSIGRSISSPEPPEQTIVTFEPAAVAADDGEEPEIEERESQPEARDEPPPAERQPPPPPRPELPPATPTTPSLVELSPNQMAAADIATIRRQPSRSAPEGRSQMGPPAPAAAADTPRVGTAPNGEPLYAAAWYREPTDEQLRGYLSTSDGPGWGLIACRTVEDYRVEDCVEIAEYPRNSNIGRSVLAAAWQFRVIPPRIGGRLQTGTWVRIRIDYDIVRR